MLSTFRDWCDALFWCCGISTVAVILARETLWLYIPDSNTFIPFKLKIILAAGVMLFFLFMTMIEDWKDKRVISNV